MDDTIEAQRDTFIDVIATVPSAAGLGREARRAGI